MSEPSTISVNFGRPIPLFPLDAVALMPQQRLPLHIFEPRYRQMVEQALEEDRLIAMAVFKGERWRQEYHGRPPLMPAVCIGRISSEERLADGCFNILLDGICRARIIRECPPEDGRLFRTAYLAPVGTETPEDQDAPGSLRIERLRARVQDSLAEGPLSRLTAAEDILRHTRKLKESGLVVLELLTVTLIADNQTRYQLLAEGDPAARADIIDGAVAKMESLIRQAQRQHPEQWPKGISWN